MIKIGEEEINLTELQDKLKRQSELFTTEFNRVLNDYKSNSREIQDKPSDEHKKFSQMITFFSHVSHLFSSELEFLPAQIINFLEQYYAILHVNFRNTLIQALILLRTKEVVSPIV
jgi:protein SDA1